MNVHAFDHVGIRVTNRDHALAFYADLGFIADPAFTTDRVAEVISAGGVRLNLIFNGVPRPDGGNVLLDEEQRWPGYTHAAFVIDSLQSIIDWAEERNVPVTEGPHDWGRRLTCFIRDPDGNVLEFNELK
jgi:catechol 2,3-dioxygenase-like lactoylglutathione lyase family enzyme